MFFLHFSSFFFSIFSSPLICVVTTELLIWGKKKRKTHCQVDDVMPLSPATVFDPFPSVPPLAHLLSTPIAHIWSFFPGVKAEHSRSSVTPNSGWICLPYVSQRDASFSTESPLFGHSLSVTFHTYRCGRFQSHAAIVESGPPYSHLLSNATWVASIFAFPPFFRLFLLLQIDTLGMNRYVPCAPAFSLNTGIQQKGNLSSLPLLLVTSAVIVRSGLKVTTKFRPFFETTKTCTSYKVLVGTRGRNCVIGTFVHMTKTQQCHNLRLEI